jgi:hypothetical protein
LYDALHELETAASKALAADPTRGEGDRRPLRYSRNAAAKAMARHLGRPISSARITEWIPDNPAAARRPDDFDPLWALVEVLSGWAGRGTPDQAWWDGRWMAAPRGKKLNPGRPRAMVGVAIAEALAAGPVAYEVHRVIHVEETPDLALVPGGERMPAYVRRGHDEQLAAVVEQAVAGASQITVLVGGSSTGKTRACWEALYRLPAGWRLWHPLTPTDLLDTLMSSGGPRVGSRTVVWLNELQRYLPANGDTAPAAAALRALLRDRGRAPVLMVGTIWPDTDRWGALTTVPGPGQPDPHAQARELLTATGITIPSEIGADRAAADTAAEQDPLWRYALTQDPDRPIQFMAGARYLLHRYQNATPAQRAVLHAAADASRTGGPTHLTLAFLQDAAQEYLKDADWQALPVNLQACGDWVRDALNHPETGLALYGPGVPGPLHPARGNSELGLVYELADYLEQHLRGERVTIQPRDSLWTAAAHHLHAAATLHAMAQAAESRGRLRPAAQLYQQAAAAGDPRACRRLAGLREGTWDRDGAEEAYYREAAAAGGVYTWLELAMSRQRAGDWAGADEADRQAAAASDLDAWIGLAERREKSGERAGAEEACWRAVAAGDRYAWLMLAAVREGAGDLSGAEEVYRQAAAAGDPDAWLELAGLRERVGDQAGADQIRHFGITVDGTPEVGL